MYLLSGTSSSMTSVSSPNSPPLTHRIIPAATEIGLFLGIADMLESKVGWFLWWNQTVLTALQETGTIVQRLAIARLSGQNNQQVSMCDS
jgi:hypothetical protein